MVKRGVQTNQSNYVYTGMAGLGRRKGPYTKCLDCQEQMILHGWWWPESELGIPEDEHVLLVEPVDWDTVPYA